MKVATSSIVLLNLTFATLAGNQQLFLDTALKARERLLEDAQSVYALKHMIDEQGDKINLYLNNEYELSPKLRNDIDVLTEYSSDVRLNDDELRDALRTHVENTINRYKSLMYSGIDSQAVKSDMETYLEQEEEYRKLVLEKFRIDKFSSLPEDEYWKTIAKENYIKKPILRHHYSSDHSRIRVISRWQ